MMRAICYGRRTERLLENYRFNKTKCVVDGYWSAIQNLHNKFNYPYNTSSECDIYSEGKSKL